MITYLKLLTLVRYAGALLVAWAVLKLYSRWQNAKSGAALLYRVTVLCATGTILFFCSLGLASLHAFLLDTDEANILSVSAACMRQSMYEPLIGATSYHPLVYGPLCFLLYHAALTVTAASFSGLRCFPVAAALASVWLLYATARRLASKAAALATVAFFSSLLVQSTFAALGLRADVWLLLSMAAACFLVVRPVSGRSAAAIGGLAGVALGFKITALPAVCLLFFLVGRRATRKSLAISVACFAAAAALPFCLPTVSLKNYVGWLHVTSTLGMQGALAGFALLQGVAVCLPLLLAYWASAPQASKPYRVDLCVAVVCVMLIAASSAKSGGGPWYLIVIFPPVLVITLQTLGQAGEADRPGKIRQSGGGDLLGRDLLNRPYASLLAISSLLVALSFANRGFSGTGYQRSSTLSSLRRTQRAVENYTRLHPDQTVYIGYGPDPAYVLSLMRYVPVAHGQPYLIDESHVIERDLVPVPEGVYAQLDSCRKTTTWLIPGGQPPFAYPFYPGRLRSAFAKGFMQLASTPDFDIYGCRRKTE